MSLSPTHTRGLPAAYVVLRSHDRLKFYNPWRAICEVHNPHVRTETLKISHNANCLLLSFYQRELERSVWSPESRGTRLVGVTLHSPKKHVVSLREHDFQTRGLRMPFNLKTCLSTSFPQEEWDIGRFSIVFRRGKGRHIKITYANMKWCLSRRCIKVS